MLHGSPPQNTHSIYIQHIAGIHCDVVLDVHLNSGSNMSIHVLDETSTNKNQYLKRKSCCDSTKFTAQTSLKHELKVNRIAGNKVFHKHNDKASPFLQLNDTMHNSQCQIHETNILG